MLLGLPSLTQATHVSQGLLGVIMASWQNDMSVTTVVATKSNPWSI